MQIKNLSKYYYLILPLIIFIFNLSYLNRFYQPTEGWWQTYGYLINEGMVPYKDFNSAIVPLFMYFNAFLLNIFGDQLIFFRLFGLFTVITTIGILQWLIAKLTNQEAAAIGLFMAFSLNMSTIVYLAYDYSSYIDILIALSLILYYKNIKSNTLFLSILYGFSLGSILTFILFMKQNIGIFYGFSIFLSAIIASKQYRSIKIVSLLIGAFVTLYQIFKLIDISTVLNGIILNNDAKGSIITVLFRFALDPYNLKILLLALSLTIIFLMSSSDFFSQKIKNNLFVIKYKLHYFAIGLLLFMYLLVFFHIEPFYSLFFQIMMAGIISIFLCIIFYLLREQKEKVNSKFIPFIFPIIVLAYCSTHTAGFNFIGMYIVAAFSISYTLHMLQSIKYLKIVHILSILLMISIISSKFVTPYNWWGLSQGNILKAKYSTNYPQLNGIKVDEKTNEFFNTVKFYVDSYSKNDHDVLTYPHIPIFYFLHKKIPPIKSTVEWFDFATTKQLSDDMEILKKNLPSIIVIFQPPVPVYQGHYKLLEHRLIQNDYDIFFNNLIKNSSYKLVHISTFSNKNDLSQFDSITREIIITHSGLDLKNLQKSISTSSELYSINSLYKLGKIDTLYFDKNNTELFIGDKLDITVREDQLDNLVRNLGFINNELSYYQLKILVKNEE